MKFNDKDFENFQNFILRWYAAHGRHELPWRQTYDPYEIMVSELMLQQTQVDRVLPKYLAFLQTFSTTKSLAHSTLAEVLSLWQGLGYNRRAKYLWETAKILVSQYDSNFPQNAENLLKLPGIGPYTANAILAFAYNKPVLLIETNVRTVFLYHFFPNQNNVHDTEILAVLEKTLPSHSSREWYYALMDYGTFLKKELPNPSRRSKHYTKQSKFEGSSRQVRGEIIRLLVEHSTLSKTELKNKITSNKRYFDDALEQLIAEQLVASNDNMLQLA